MSAHLDIDLGLLAANLARIRDTVAPARHMLVVKDDAYGHGLPAVVARAVSEGVSWFGTFDVATAIAVREAAGPDARILAWTVYDAAEIDAAADAGIDLGVGDAVLLEEVIARGVRARVHLKVDTGLHRNGVRPEDWHDAVERARAAQRAGAIEIAGVWSHIAEASDAEDDASRELFVQAAGAFEDGSVLRHLAASAASFARPGFRFDLVRIGAFAYGIRPESGPSDQELGIRPVAALVADVTGVSGDDVTIGVGYLDGLDSRLSGRLAVATPGGERALGEIGPTSSRVRSWPGAQVGDEVSVLGRGAPSSMTDAAELVGTIGEQVLLRLSPRLPRRYR